MKLFALFLMLLTLIIAVSAVTDPNEKRGCIIKEKNGKCCWINNNSCCPPPKAAQKCTTGKTKCCKTKSYNAITKKYTYIYTNK